MSPKVIVENRRKKREWEEGGGYAGHGELRPGDSEHKKNIGIYESIERPYRGRIEG